MRCRLPLLLLLAFAAGLTGCAVRPGYVDSATGRAYAGYAKPAFYCSDLCGTGLLRCPGCSLRECNCDVPPYTPPVAAFTPIAGFGAAYHNGPPPLVTTAVYAPPPARYEDFQNNPAAAGPPRRRVAPGGNPNAAPPPPAPVPTPAPAPVPLDAGDAGPVPGLDAGEDPFGPAPPVGPGGLGV